MRTRTGSISAKCAKELLYVPNVSHATCRWIGCNQKPCHNLVLGDCWCRCTSKDAIMQDGFWKISHDCGCVSGTAQIAHGIRMCWITHSFRLVYSDKRTRTIRAIRAQFTFARAVPISRVRADNLRTRVSWTPNLPVGSCGWQVRNATS